MVFVIHFTVIFWHKILLKLLERFKGITRAKDTMYKILRIPKQLLAAAQRNYD